jgi:DNA-binding CsgD family transcriptional regulator
MGVKELSLYPVLPFMLDALLTVGELDRAEELVAFLEGLAAETGRTWTVGLAGRGRAQLRAVHGDFDGARAAIAVALEAHAGSGVFELACTRLAAGEIERRARQKRAVREQLEPALAAFEALGARPYAERTAAALRRLGVRGQPSEGLTETERRIAELAADGRTNREIADALFVSPKTVEGNLSRVYQKLQVRSRVDLARALEPR